MSYKVEVLVAGETAWVTNALRFSTEHEAETYGKDLSMRWLAVKEWRVTEDTEPANYRINDGELEPIRE